MNYKNYIVKLIGDLQRRLYLNEYTVRLLFDEDLPADHDLEVYADISVQTDYLQARIRLGKCMRQLFKEKNYRRLAEILVHELCHILIEPVSELAVDAIPPVARPMFNMIEERQVQRIANVIMTLLPAKVYEP